MPNPCQLFADLIALLKAEVIVMPSAYFDESGTDSASAFTSVAGYVFEREQALEFNEEWRDALAAAGVSAFHMADCAHGAGEYREIAKPARAALAQRCIGIIKRRARIGVAVSVAQRDFARFADLAIAKDPYVLCLLWCLAGVEAWAAVRAPDRRFCLFFEDGHRMRHRANDAITHMEQLARSQGRGRYSSYTFIGKTEAYPLQAADLLAWEWRAEMMNALGPHRRPRRLSLRSLAEAPHLYCHLSADHIEALHTLNLQPDVLRFHDLRPQRALTVVTRKLATE